MGEVIEADNYKYCEVCDKKQYNESWSCRYCGYPLEPAAEHWMNGN